MKQKGLVSFQKLVMYFIKKGKRSLIENKVRTFLTDKKRLKKRKSLILKEAEKSLNNVTPYVRLLIRKRGKRSIYKVGYLEKKRSNKKAYLSIAKGLKEVKKEYFLTALQKEISASVSKKGALVVKRNDLHKTAKRFAPYSWSRKMRKEKAKKKKNLRNQKRYKYMSKKELYELKVKELYEDDPLRIYFKRKARKCIRRKKRITRYKRLKATKVKRRRLSVIRKFYIKRLEGFKQKKVLNKI